jgi:toxin ParE1/3/4
VRGVEFHPDAEAELISAARYYEGHAANLGFDFVAAVERSYRRLTEYPEIGRPFGRGLRRVLIPGFPYGLIYRVVPDRILIVAVAHSIAARATGAREADPGSAEVATRTSDSPAYDTLRPSPAPPPR